MGIMSLDPKTINAFAEMVKALEKIYGAVEYVTISTTNTNDYLIVHYKKAIKREHYLRRYQRRGERMRKHGK